MDKHFDNQMKPNEFEQSTGVFPMKLQLFASGDVDWRKIMETQPPADADEDEAQSFLSKPIFRTANDGADVDPSDSDEEDDELDDEYDPLFIPRLNVTDSNMPYLAEGEMVIADEDGVLSTATVDDDGNLSVSALYLDGEAIADGSISGSKLEEGAITSRELDIEEIFADNDVINQIMAENFDVESLFENQGFLDKFKETQDGKDGQSAYDAALLGGYQGTQQVFYTDLGAMTTLAAELAAL